MSKQVSLIVDTFEHALFLVKQNLRILSISSTVTLLYLLFSFFLPSYFFDNERVAYALTRTMSVIGFSYMLIATLKILILESDGIVQKQTIMSFFSQWPCYFRVLSYCMLMFSSVVLVVSVLSLIFLVVFVALNLDILDPSAFEDKLIYMGMASFASSFFLLYYLFRLHFGVFLILEKNAGMIRSFIASWKISKGYFSSSFLFYLLIFSQWGMLLFFFAYLHMSPNFYVFLCLFFFTFFFIFPATVVITIALYRRVWAQFEYSAELLTGKIKDVFLL